MADIVCISPVDGREVARKRPATEGEIAIAVAAAREAQTDWAHVTIVERGRLCLAAVEAMLAMRAEIAPELAWQMGRPVKFGGGELNGFEERAGLPKGLFQTLTLSHDATVKLIASGAIDQVCFTGSVTAGRAIEQAAAGTFAGVGLELGGKDPAYVRGDADLAHAVENLVDGS